MGGGRGGKFSGTKGGKKLLSADTITQAKAQVQNLPGEVQASVKRFLKRGSRFYQQFSAERLANGNILVKMTKPGDVPGSKAIYYKIIGPKGNTIQVYKETYTPDGKLIHTKEK